MPWGRAHLPDAGVGIPPVRHHVSDQVADMLPSLVADRVAVLVEEIDGVHQLAEDVELDLLVSAIADANGAALRIPRQVRQLDFRCRPSTPIRPRENAAGQVLTGRATVQEARVVAATGAQTEDCVMSAKVDGSTLRFEPKLSTDGWNGKIAFMGGGGFDGAMPLATDLFFGPCVKRSVPVAWTRASYGFRPTVSPAGTG
jgi:hypothetical protein